jgi:isopenicillin-N N-acyltransferase-like protein
MQIDRRMFIGGASAAGLLGALEPLAQAAAPRLPFPEVTLTGSPGNRGMSHGRSFRFQIKRNLDFYFRLISTATGKDPARLLEVASSFAPVLRRLLPEQLEEMEGIAKGSKRKLSEILLINARTDMLVLGRRKPQPRRTQKASAGCTSLALSERIRGKTLLALGQNWDWRKDLKGGTVILRVKPDKGPRVVTFTEAGMLGKVGFNEHRLGVCLNFLQHSTDDPRGEPGLPVHCLLRAVMGCETLEQAYKLVAWAPRCASANFLMAQHRDKGNAVALDLEWSPQAVARLPMRDGVLVHTNHFKAPALSPGCGSGGKGRSTLNRNRVAGDLARKLKRKLRDPAQRMRKILASRDGAPYSVSKTSAPDSSSMTLAGIVMDLSRNRLHLTGGPPHRVPWVTRPGV